MGSLGFIIRIAVKDLLRGGQRVFVALLCIAFGVMSLVAMTLLTQSLEKMLVLEPALLVGADISMDRVVEDVILPEHEADLQAAQAEGVIDRYTLVAYSSSVAFRLPGSGELHFPNAGIGIDPANYPLVGSFAVSKPQNVGLETLLQEPGDILVTYDIALDYDLQEGDLLTLTSVDVGKPVEAVIRAIVTDTPNHQGSKIYYNLATAELLANGSRYLNTALVTADDPLAAHDRFLETNWRPFLATKLALGDENVLEIFEVTLKGAAILGLLVGGIGIANTMQVLLHRRRREVAIWKTLGYRENHIQGLFAVEAALLGGVGSLVGATIGVGLSYTLTDLFSRTSTMLIRWSFSPEPVITGVVVGTLTTVLFSMVAIVAASRVQPVALLRNEPVPATRLGCLQNVLLVALVGLPFAGLTSLVMESVLKGVGVLLVALLGLVTMGGFLGVLMWLTVRLLPVGRLPLVNMARNNLKRRGISLIFAMIALFVGIVSLSMGGMMTINAQSILDKRQVEYEGNNLAVIAPVEQEAAVRAALEAQGVESVTPGYLTTALSIREIGAEENTLSSVIIARESAEQYLLEGEPWGSVPDGVYVYSFMTGQAGSTVEITLLDGSTHIFPIAGTYRVSPNVVEVGNSTGLLMPAELSLRLTEPDSIQYYARVSPDRLQTVATALGNALPETTVIDLVLYAARFSQVYQNLFIFAAAMAGLALLAGVLLIANSVSIAMIDRRYEIGVLKTVGYRRGHILWTLVVEYSLVAVIASAAGLGIVQLFLAIMRAANPIAAFLFTMPLPTTVLIGLACTGLTLITVLLVTLQPTRVSPVVVLNDRE